MRLGRGETGLDEIGKKCEIDEILKQRAIFYDKGEAQ
jgi:hypothetical protein